MTAVTLPPLPRPVPPLTADAATVRDYAADLLAASAQLDDLGSFVAGGARIDDWHGLAASSYHLAIEPLGRRADAMSLALRGVARRCDSHADALTRLLARREGAEQHRAHLVAQIDQLRARAGAATGPDAARLQVECDDCARQVRAYEADLDAWGADLAAEEEGMRSAFERVLTLEEIERTYAGVEDPADEALAGMPGPDATPVEVNAWWDGLTHAEQLAIVAAAPRAIGNRDGIPAWARHDANTVALDSDLAAWEHLETQGLLTPEEERWLENARAAKDAIGTIEAGIDPATLDGVESQLYLYDPTAFDGDGAIAVSAGSLDTAANVAVVVPGLGTDAESAPYQAERALTLYEASRYLDGVQDHRGDVLDRVRRPRQRALGRRVGRRGCGPGRPRHSRRGAPRRHHRRAACLPGRRACPPDRDRAQLRLHDRRTRGPRPRAPGRRPRPRRQPGRRR